MADDKAGQPGLLTGLVTTLSFLALVVRGVMAAFRAAGRKR